MTLKLQLPEFKTLKKSNKESIYSPLKGEAKSLYEMNDQAFSQMGKGGCIIPSEGKVVAPCDGIITTLFHTGHAFGITSYNGTEILIHIGCDTVQIEDGFFIKHKNQGDRVNKGDTIITFSLDKLKMKGYNPETAVVVTNSKSYLDIIKICDKKIDYLDEFLITINTESLG